VNTDKCLRYKDTWVAPGTTLYEILSEKKKGWQERAEQHYQQLEQTNRDLEKRYGIKAVGSN
jgi:hypothetical protein